MTITTNESGKGVFGQSTWINDDLAWVWDRGGWSHGSYTLVDDNHVFYSLFGVHTACSVVFP